MKKKEARDLYRSKRESLSFAEKSKFDDLLLIQFQSVELPFLNYVLSYYPMDDRNEADTFLITDYLRFKNPNLRICYPKTNFESATMEAVECHADTIFTANSINLPEPTDTNIAQPHLLDLVIVPLLIFDLAGSRVGYGKGFYDRYLMRCRPDCIKVGLSYFDAIDTIDDKGQFDVPLDFCITPERTYVF